MRRGFFLFVVAVVAGVMTWAYSSSSSAAVRDNKSAEETITQLERSWMAAIVNKDFATLDRLLASDFVGTSPTGHTYSKEMAIADLKSGRYVVGKMDLDEIFINAYGNTMVAFTSQREESMYGGEDFSGHYHYTDVWVRRNGRWQVVASHGSRFNDVE